MLQKRYFIATKKTLSCWILLDLMKKRKCLSPKRWENNHLDFCYIKNIFSARNDFFSSLSLLLFRKLKRKLLLVPLFLIQWTKTLLASSCLLYSKKVLTRCQFFFAKGNEILAFRTIPPSLGKKCQKIMMPCLAAKSLVDVTLVPLRKSGRLSYREY